MTTEDTFTITEGNCTTGETIVRDMTPEEISQLLADREAFAVIRAEQEAAAEALATLKASAKAKLIAGEPLTAEEADTLVI